MTVLNNKFILSILVHCLLFQDFISVCISILFWHISNANDYCALYWQLSCSDHRELEYSDWITRISISKAINKSIIKYKIIFIQK